MSLLGDALRRKEQEADRSGGGQADTSTAVPGSPVDSNQHAEKEGAQAPPPLPSRGKHKTEWVAAVVVVIVLALFAGVLGVLYYVTAEEHPEETLPPERPVSSPTGIAESTPAAPVEREQTNDAPRVSPVRRTIQQARELSQREPLDLDAVMREEDERIASSDASPQRTTPPDKATAAPPVVVQKEQAPLRTPEKPVVPKADWPTITIRAAMGSGVTGSVLIDGEIVPVGQPYGDLHILEITPRGVRIGYAGEERIIPVRR